MTGTDPMGLSDATGALAELADLADLEEALRQDYPGARLDDVDEEAVRRALGRQAVDDMEALRQIERELEQQGYLQRTDGKLELTPKAVRRLGETALRKVFAELPDGGTGDHEPARRRPGRRVHRQHPPLAVRRRAGHRRRRHGAERAAPPGRAPSGVPAADSRDYRKDRDRRRGGVRLSVGDFEVS